MPISDRLEQFVVDAKRPEVVFPDQAPSLAPWGSLAPRIAHIIKYTPSLAERLLCAPRAAFHASAIYLLHHSHKDEKEAGAALLELSPIAHVSSCFTPAQGYMAALKKCGPYVHQTSFYTELNQFLLSHLAGELSLENNLTPKLLTFIGETRNLDPLVLPARHGLHLERQSAHHFDSMIKFCRRLGVIWDYGSEAKAVRQAAASGLGRYITRRLERCVSPWSFELPPPLRQIGTARELAKIASEHGNCLGLVKYRVKLGLGSHLYVIGDEPFNCLLELRHEHGNLWAISESESLETRRKPTEKTLEQVCELLQQAGLEALPATFGELWENTMSFHSPDPQNLFGEWV